MLAAEAGQFLDRIAADEPEEEIVVAAPAVAADEPLFRARLIGIGYDPDRRLVLIELRESGDEDRPPEDDDGYVARLYATRPQVRAMARGGTTAVEAGRPNCPLCDFPMDPAGHLCPRLN